MMAPFRRRTGPRRTSISAAATEPVHSWNLCTSGSTSWWETADGNVPNGSVDVLAMLNWLVSHGQLPTGAQLVAVGYGFEISSTGGADENFQVSSFSITAS